MGRPCGLVGGVMWMGRERKEKKVCVAELVARGEGRGCVWV